MQNFMKLLETVIIIHIIKKTNSKNTTQLIKMASKQGYNITNPKDRFFNDLCSPFTSEKEKDVSLEYRRKYYYFPKGKINSTNDQNLDTIFKKPFRNSIYKCIFIKRKFNIKIVYLCFLVFIPVFILQHALLGITVWEDYAYSLMYTPVRKSRLLSKNKKNKDENSNINENLSSEDSNRGIKATSKEDLKISNQVNFNVQRDFNFAKCDFPSFGPNIKCKIDIKEQNNEIPNQENKKNDEDQKSNDNNENTENSENSETSYAVGDIADFIYEKINKNSFKSLINVNIKPSKKIIVSEEYFYFSFNDACNSDNRDIFQIYKDLLEQCQIYFKLNSIMNIYEDKAYIIVYYCFKIYLHFLLHVLFFKMSYINYIYDNIYKIFSMIFKSLFLTLIVTIVSDIAYSFTNAKQLAIKIGLKIMDLKVRDEKFIHGVLDLKNKILLSILFFKTVGLYIICIVFFIISFTLYYIFCNVYPNTKVFIFGLVILNIFISQTSPFILCWIPAYIRSKALRKKNEKLYYLCTLIETLFIP